MHLHQYLGDSVTHTVPLLWRGISFEPGNAWGLIWTAKEKTSDPDSAAAIQKASGLGITVTGSVASIALVPQDSAELAASVLVWDIQAQHLSTGEVRTVAFGRLELARDVTRETSTSIPVQTTEPPYPGGGDPAVAIHAADAKPLLADDDEFGMADSADSWSLKKATWSAIKARLKAYFDTLYQAAGVTWATLSGKPSTFPPIIGSGSGDAVAGNDARLSDARPTTPASLVAAAEGMTSGQEGQMRSAIQVPKIGLPIGSNFGPRLMSEARPNHPQLRALCFGDSIAHFPSSQLRSILGPGGWVGSVVNGTANDNCVLAGGATATNSIGNSAAYAKSFTGSWANLGTGTAIFARGGTNPYLGRRIFVWFWSESNGGTFTVEADTNGSGSYTTLRSGTLSGGSLNGISCTVGGNATINASGVVDAAEGGATGALRCLIFDLPSPYYLRIRCNGSGSTGSAKIIAAGPVEVEASASRNPGVVHIDCAMAGSTPAQWDDIPDAAIQTLMEHWNPDAIYVRGFETLADWQNSFAPMAAKFLAIKPSLEFVLVGMHVTAAENTNQLTEIDLWQQQWCDQNNGVFIPVRNRMGTIDWSIENRIARDESALTVTNGNASTNVLTLSSPIAADANGRWLRLEARTGGAALVVGRAYRVLSGQGTNSIVLADYDGATSISIGTTITAATLTLIDGTHLSSDGQAFVQGLVLDGMMQFVLSRLALTGRSPEGQWQRIPFSQDQLQSEPQNRQWMWAGPSYRRREISIGRNDGAQTALNYYSTASFGANELDRAFIAGPLSSGLSFCWDTNFGVFGVGTASSSWRALNTITNGVRDMVEFFSTFNDVTPLTASSVSTLATHAPLQVWRNGSSSSSKGTEVARMDALGRLRPTVPEYANDAAADADTALLSGFLYRVTGNRAVFRKP